MYDMDDDDDLMILNPAASPREQHVRSWGDRPDSIRIIWPASCTNLRAAPALAQHRRWDRASAPLDGEQGGRDKPLIYVCMYRWIDIDLVVLTNSSPTPYRLLPHQATHIPAQGLVYHLPRHSNQPIALIVHMSRPQTQILYPISTKTLRVGR